MRELTSKQKKLIKKWFKESEKKDPWESMPEYSLKNADDLSGLQWSILEVINDTEVLYQNVNSFINDLHEEVLMATGWYD